MRKKDLDHFKDDLKELASGYEIPVQKEVFNLLMDKRAHRKERRRKRFIYIFTITFSCLLLYSILFLFGYFNSNNSTKLSYTKPSINEKKQIVAINKGGTKTRIVPPANIDNKRKTNFPNSNINSTSNIYRQLNKNAINKHVLPFKSELNDMVNTHFIKNNDQSRNKIETSLLNSNKFITGSIPKHDSIIHLDTTTTKLPIVGIPIDSVLNHLNKPDSIINKQKTQEKIWKPAIFMNTTWLPIATLKNDNLSIPNNLADSFGLSNIANHILAINGGISISLHKNWQLGVGIGFYHIKFDEIRTTNLPRDTSLIESLTTASKSPKNYLNQSSEIALNYLEVPVFLKWIKPSSKPIKLYALAGFNYQYLISSSSYAFSSDMKGEVSYEKKSNYQFNQFNTNRLNLMLESGYLYQFNKYFGFGVGIHLKQDISALYIDGTKTSIGTSIGINASLQINIKQ
jgi:hypothetical protein